MPIIARVPQSLSHLQFSFLLTSCVDCLQGGNAADNRVWHMTRVSAPPQATDICLIGFRNSAPGKQWEWSDGSPSGFQNWLGGEGGAPH